MVTGFGCFLRGVLEPTLTDPIHFCIVSFLRGVRRVNLIDLSFHYSRSPHAVDGHSLRDCAPRSFTIRPLYFFVLDLGKSITDCSIFCLYVFGIMCCGSFMSHRSLPEL